jgi:argininosuccinate lyase
MQEDKEHLFDAVDTLELALAAARGMVSSITFNRERLAAAAADEFLAATDVADLLVTRGVPFREAHAAVASLVRSAIAEGKTLSELTLDQLRDASPMLDQQFYTLLADRAWLESKVSQGGTSLAMVRRQLERASAQIERARAGER